MTDHSVNGTGSGINGHSESGDTTITDHSVTGTDSGLNRPSEPRNNIGRDSPPDSTARGLDRLPEPIQLRYMVLRRIFVGNINLCIVMATAQTAAARTTTPQVVGVTLTLFRAFLEHRLWQAAWHPTLADASEADEEAIIRRWVGPTPRLFIVCSYEQWWQLQADFPGECLWSIPE
ncbi:hypothetical protein E4U58_004518 [Claviceps cyperi]|nr:hypothetical protein E4U58_004518 [Claviceps cyperi]